MRTPAQQPAASLACLSLGPVLCAAPHSIPATTTPSVEVCHVAPSTWSWRLWLASVWWVCSVCAFHASSSSSSKPLLVPHPLLVLPFGKPGAPAPPPTCGLACGGGGFDADGVTSLVLKSLLVVFRAAWKPTSNTASFPFPPSHHYTTTTCTACMLALLLAAIINHDHQGDNMLRRFTAKAGAMARRGSTLPGPGEVACVMHFGRTRAC